MKKIIYGFLLTSFLIVGVSCGTNNAPTTNSTAVSTTESQVKEEVKVTLSLVEDEKQIASKEISVSEDESVLNILKEQYEVKDDGGFVTSIDGKEQDADNNKYWMYYINDEEAAKGAAETFVKDKDVIEWRLNEFK